MCIAAAMTVCVPEFTGRDDGMITYPAAPLDESIEVAASRGYVMTSCDVGLHMCVTNRRTGDYGKLVDTSMN